MIPGKNGRFLKQGKTHSSVGMNTGAHPSTLKIINLLLVNNGTGSSGICVLGEVTCKLLWCKLSFAGITMNDFIDGFLAAPEQPEHGSGIHCLFNHIFFMGQK